MSLQCHFFIANEVTLLLLTAFKLREKEETMMIRINSRTEQPIKNISSVLDK